MMPNPQGEHLQMTEVLPALLKVPSTGKLFKNLKGDVLNILWLPFRLLLIFFHWDLCPGRLTSMTFLKQAPLPSGPLGTSRSQESRRRGRKEGASIPLLPPCRVTWGSLHHRSQFLSGDPLPLSLLLGVRGCHRLYPLKIHTLKPNPQCDGNRR